jgi:hypothetical protein
MLEASAADESEPWPLRGLVGKVVGSMRRRVVITGIGVINPMGHDVETMWDGLK